MSLQTLKKLRSERGFTIVELLIVIVVIGILAAIVIVAYNGVQDKAHTTTAQSNAKEVVNKAEVYAAENDGTYPTAATLKAATNDDSWKLSETVAALTGTNPPAASGTATNTNATSKDNIQLQVCGTTAAPAEGIKVLYWDFSAKSAVTLTGGVTDDSTETCA